MKTHRLVLIVALAFVGFSNVPSTLQAQVVSVNFSSFYNELGHYGRWVNNPKYGQVWVYNQPGFRPYYSGGHWDYTDYGWSWVSDYPWGWAPFHYGRWEEDPYDGWIWIPGYEWAPAWVSWSEYDGYYGWAPLGYGVNFNVSFGSVPYNRWVFVPRQRICEYNVHNYYVQPKGRYFNNAVIINNYYNYGGNRYWAGPKRVEVERYVQRPIQTRSPQWGSNSGTVSRNDNWRDQGRNWNNPNTGHLEQRPVENQGRSNPVIENQQGNRDNRNNRYFDRQPNQYPVDNHHGIENRRPQIENPNSGWENRPGSKDRRITRDAFPQQNNQPGNIDRNRIENQRQSIPQNNNRNNERMTPRNFPNHNNAIMRNEGHGKTGNDMKGGNGRIK